jgi:hypothetical protein
MNSTTPAPRIAFLEHVQDNILVDALSVTLEDPTGSFGIRELLTEVVTVPPGAPTVHVSLGMYEFNINLLNKQLEYEIFWKVIDTFGNTQYIYGLIPKVTTKSGGGGPTVPSGAIGVPVDLNDDGYFIPDFDGWDGYKYDLNDDGYYESFDFDNDGTIDAVDVGKVTGFSPRVAVIGSGSTGGVFDPRGVRVGLGGNLIAGGAGSAPPPDGIPDVPSPKGTPAKDGTWGGTYGYDGTSGQIPATGGARTNRDNKGGDGFWDGISFEKLCVVPIGPRGSCVKDQTHAIVRAMLKDTDPKCYAFTEDEIDMYLESSLWAFNARPTFTNFMWDTIQLRWIDIIAKGAVVWALYAQGLVEAGREFTINENGISFTPPPVSDKLHGYASALLAHYDTQLAEIKQNFRPVPAAVGIFSVLDISPSLRRLRHLREKRIF